MWQYGLSGELTDVRNASFTGAEISRYAYTYNATLRRTAVAKSGRAFATEDDISYGYNYRSELTNATAQADSTYRYAYDFDDIGNRKTSAERTAPSVSYTANSLNQYTAIDDFVPTYDADGNQTLVKTKTGIWHVTYNGENRPVRWECGTNIITMTYDRMGRRISKNDQTFIYDGYLQIADNRGSCYIWDPTEPVATRPLVRNNSEFYFHDGNKNVSDILSATGSVLSHYDYAPFGDCTAVGSNPWRFSSEYSDDDLGLIYYNYRHYDPVTGRWMNRDFAGEDGDIALYTFVNGIFLIDILGMYMSDKLLDYIEKFSSSRCGKFIECMGDCIQNNDPIEKAVNKILFQFLTGVYSKEVVARFMELCGRHDLAHNVRRAIRMGGRITNLESVIAMFLENKHTRVVLRRLGDFVTSVNTLYGLYMLQVEGACAGYCSQSEEYNDLDGVVLTDEIVQLIISGIEDAFK